MTHTDSNFDPNTISISSSNNKETNMTNTNIHAASSDAINNMLDKRATAAAVEQALDPIRTFTAPLTSIASAIGTHFEDYMDKMALLSAAIDNTSDDQLKRLADLLAIQGLCNRKAVIGIIHERMQNNDGPVDRDKFVEMITEHMDEANVVTHDEIDELIGGAIEENPENYMCGNDVEAAIEAQLEDHDTEISDRIDELDGRIDELERCDRCDDLEGRIDELEDGLNGHDENSDRITELETQIESLSTELDVMKTLCKMMVSRELQQHSADATHLQAQARLIQWTPEADIDIPRVDIDEADGEDCA